MRQPVRLTIFHYGTDPVVGYSRLLSSRTNLEPESTGRLQSELPPAGSTIRWASAGYIQLATQLPAPGVGYYYPAEGQTSAGVGWNEGVNLTFTPYDFVPGGTSTMPALERSSARRTRPSGLVSISASWSSVGTNSSSSFFVSTACRMK